MADERAPNSVLDLPPPDSLRLNGTGHVILINRRWLEYLKDYEDEDEKLAQIPDESDDQKPLEGCPLEDLGWIRVRYDCAQIDGTLGLREIDFWRIHYYCPPEVAPVKESIGQINILRSGSNEIRTLCGLAFLPVRQPDGTFQLRRVTDAFFIADRIEYLDAFRDRVPMLDYSLEECRRFNGFLTSLGLEDRYLSTAVQEETFVDRPSDQRSSRLTSDFRRKASAIYRCILHYKGDEPLDSLRSLQNAEVLESDGFRKTLVLDYGEVREEVQSDSGLVHIETVDERMRIYIPRTAEERQRCYSLHLPKALQTYFKVRAAEAHLTLQLVFLSPEVVLDQLLDGNGIVAIPNGISMGPYSEPDSGIDPGSEEEHDIRTAEAGTDQSSESSTPIDTPLSSTPLNDGMTAQERPIVFRQGAVSPAPRPFLHMRDDPTPEPVLVLPEESTYSQLLDNVIRVARHRQLADILQGPSNLATGIANIAHEDVFGSRSQRQLEHDIKIGAAGELFVFELLLCEEFPHFNRTNWRSTIRKHVSIHPDYADMDPWMALRQRI
ncbi:hypothetical protein BDV06DRAFT_229203 [Aspergillus oleicola]